MGVRDPIKAKRATSACNEDAENVFACNNASLESWVALLRGECLLKQGRVGEGSAAKRIRRRGIGFGGMSVRLSHKHWNLHYVSLVFAALGLGLNLVWCTLMGHTLGFLSPAFDSALQGNPRLFFLAGILMFSLAYVSIPRWLKRADGSLRFVLPLIAAFGTTCFGLSSRQTFLDPATLAVCGLFVAGVCYFWLVARYSLMVARTQGFAISVACVAGGLVVKLPILLAISVWASPEVQVIIAIIVPLVSALVFEASCALMRKEAQVLDEEEGGRPKENRSVSNKAPAEIGASPVRTVFGVPAIPRLYGRVEKDQRRMVFVLVLTASVVLAVIRSVSYLGMWGNTDAVISTELPLITGVALPAFCVVIFAYIVLIRLANYPLAVRFQPALLLILIGLLVVAVQASPDGASLGFLATVIQIDELLAHLLFWAIVITALDVLDMPSYRVIGTAGALYAGVSIAWVFLLSSAPIIITLLMMLVTYALVIAALYLIWAFSHNKTDGVLPCSLDEGLEQEEAEDGTKLTRTIMDTCTDMADRYGLSPRETEVFILLAQGRTRVFIQDELVLSGSTVKTHVSHIYTKMDVHDRQEMMDLIWSVPGPDVG